MGKKIALLIGVSEYDHGLNPLPGAANDIEALERVLKKPEIGGFDIVANNNQIKTIRGGSWVSPPDDCRSACRNSSDRRVNFPYIIGFRVVCAIAISPTNL